MTKTFEVFENEEAERFLEYFSAYKKFSIKADFIRRMITSNSDITSSGRNPELAKTELPEAASQDLLTIDLSTAHAGVDLTPTRPQSL